MDSVNNALSPLEGIKSTDIDLAAQSVVVETTLPLLNILHTLEGTGLTTVVRGMGGVGGNSGAAVAILKSDDPNINGVVRFVQLGEDSCLIDATVHGISPGLHGFHIHEYGDWSNGCLNAGGHYNPHNVDHGGPDDEVSHVGDLGNLEANAEGKANYRAVITNLNVWDIIGRGIVVHADEDDLGKGGDEGSRTTGNAGGRLACGTIARSPGVFENSKRICLCNGTTIWEEDNDAQYA